MGKFCAESSFEIVIISHNLTNKFQSLDISANKAAKSFISGKYNAWLANEVSKQLRAEKAAADVKVSLKLSVIKPLHRKWILKLSVIKPLHRKWIVDLYNTLKDDKEMAINGFRSAGITETFENGKVMVEKVGNPFKKV